MMMALKLERPCPHCGEALIVAFKSDMKGGLMAAVVHGLYESLDLSGIQWRPVKGFEAMVKLPESSEVPW
jgi:hypothetical protein